MGYADIRCDNWALGVVLYLLLSGRFPFRGDNVRNTLTCIMNGVFTLDDPAFFSSSFEVKDLICRLMTRNPNERCTAFHAYHHPWVQRMVDEDSRDIVISDEVLSRLREYQDSTVFEKIIFYMIALKVDDKDIYKFKEIFQKIDSGGDGMLNLEEFHEGRTFC